MKLDNRRNLTSKIAYIAGFIDGEGCIRIKKSNTNGHSYYVTLHVTNSDPRPLNAIKEIFGGKVFCQEKKATGKTIWQYYSTTAEAVDTLRALVGFLINKKEQALLAIEFQDNKHKMRADERDNRYEVMRQLKHEIYSNPELLINNYNHKPRKTKGRPFYGNQYVSVYESDAIGALRAETVALSRKR